MTRRNEPSRQERPAPRYEFPCTECGGDAFVAYAAGKKNDAWNGKVKRGERLCTACFVKRGGQRFL